MTEERRLDFLVVSAGLLSVLFAIVGWLFGEIYALTEDAHNWTRDNAKTIGEINQRMTENEKWMIRTEKDMNRLRDLMTTFLDRLPNKEQ